MSPVHVLGVVLVLHGGHAPNKMGTGLCNDVDNNADNDSNNNGGNGDT